MKIFQLATLSILTAMMLITASAQQGIGQGIPSYIEAVYIQTDNRTNIPLRVPSSIPLNSPAAPTNYWADSISEDHFYSISFDRAEDCTEIIECSFANVRGELASSSSTNYQELASQSRNQLITLEDGTPALFSPYREGLYTPSSVYVQIDEYLYTFSIYMADQADVVAMANSALSVFSQ